MHHLKSAFFILFAIISSSGIVFGQKIELNNTAYCVPSVISFNDGTYVLYTKCESGKNQDRKWSYFNANGELLSEKSIKGKIAWDFSNDSEKPSTKYVQHSMVDPEKKVCYSLYASEEELKIYVTGLDLVTKEILIPSTVFKPKYSGFTTSEVYYLRDHSMQSYFDNAGNPCWLIQKNTGGYVFVNYNPSTEKATVKFNAMKTESSIVGYKFIGRKNEKSWMIEMIDKGQGKTTYKLKLYSIDDSGVQKDEGEMSFPKASTIVNSNVSMVTSLDGTEQLLFAVTHFAGQMIEIDFFTFTDKITCVKWKVEKGVEMNIVPAIGHHKSSDGTDDFILYDGNTGIKFDVNFDNESLDINTVEKKYNSYSYVDAWNFLLYWDDLNEQQHSTITAILSNPLDDQRVYRLVDGKYIIIKEVNAGKEKPGKGELYLQLYR